MSELIKRPTKEEAERIVHESERHLAERLAELEKKLPRWDPEMDRVRITI